MKIGSDGRRKELVFLLRWSLHEFLFLLFRCGNCIPSWCEGMEVEMTWGVRGSDTQALGREHCRVRLHTLEACPFSRNEMVGVSLFRSLCHL